MKILCQVLAVNPYMLLVSLPNQLLGHIPITQISMQFTQALEAADKAMEENDPEDGSSSIPDIPDLRDLFQPGQYLRAVVTAMNPPGTTPTISVGHARDALEKSCQRIELGTAPEFVNEGLAKSDLQTGVVSEGRSCKPY
jgi:rRNA biogenesis protein RRP5